MPFNRNRSLLIITRFTRVPINNRKNKKINKIKT